MWDPCPVHAAFRPLPLAGEEGAPTKLGSREGEAMTLSSRFDSPSSLVAVATGSSPAEAGDVKGRYAKLKEFRASGGRIHSLLFPSPSWGRVEVGVGCRESFRFCFSYLHKQQHALLPPPLVPPHKGEGNSVLIAFDRPLL